MSNLMHFDFHGNDVRLVMRDGEPWWSVADVCRVLDIRNVTDASNRLDEDEKDSVPASTFDSTEGGPERLIVNESGLYNLVMGSRKPEAKAFKRWVTREVLPQIRKTGTYSVAPPTQAELALQMAQALVEQEKRLTVVESRVSAIENRQREAEAELVALPAPTGTVADITPRALLNRLIRSYSMEQNLSHQVLWNRLYTEFRDRYHVDLKARSTKNVSPLDVAERLGHVQTLYNLAKHLFGSKSMGA